MAAHGRRTTTTCGSTVPTTTGTARRGCSAVSRPALATGVTPGAPGQFLPAPPAFRPPNTIAELNTINGGAAWTTFNQHVTVGGADYYWDGTRWLPNHVPAALATGVTPGAPGQFTPGAPAFLPPVDKNELDTINPGPVPWATPGDYVTVAGTQYWWDGTQWDIGVVPTPVATGATPGAPGQFTPVAGHRPPATKVELDTITAGAAWTNPGDYIDTADGNSWHWDGAAWQAGPVIAPLSTGATSGAPGAFTPTPPASTPPVSKAELDTITPTGGAWATGGDYIVVAGADYYWDGAAWVAGRVPTGPQLATDASEGIPGTWLPAGSLAPQTLPELQSIIPSAGAWTAPGSHITIPTGPPQPGGFNAPVEYYYDGAAWVQGRVPGIPPATVDPGTIGWVGGAFPAVTTPYPQEIKVYYKQGSPGDGISIQWSPFDTTNTVDGPLHVDEYRWRWPDQVRTVHAEQRQPVRRDVLGDGAGTPGGR